MYMTQGLHRGVRHRPDAPATIFGGRVRTVRQHAERVARLAGALRRLGVRDGERVGILALNSDRYAEVLLAVPWANGVLVPVNVRWAVGEIVLSLNDCQADVLFVDDAFAEQAPALRDGCTGLETLIHLGDGPCPDQMAGYEDLIAESTPIDDARRGGAELAGIFYTGGTTGSPKGVMLNHANLTTSLLGVQATAPIVVPDGRCLLVAPMFHLATLAPWLAQLMVGGSHVILPAFDSVPVLRAIARHEVTSVALIPTLIQALVDHPALPEHDLSSVQNLPYGGSPISKTLLERAMRAFPRAGFTQIYGMTELAGIATMLGPADHQAGKLLRSAGRAPVHTEVRIVDPEDHDHEVPRGVVGEIACRGGQVMLGYWNQPQQTALVLRDGWMHTGDGGFMDDDGYVYVVDRIKDMIVSGGENVYSAEVENAVAAHPAVASCAVIGVPDPTWGERVHAVIVLKPDRTATAHEIREHCRNLIAGYKAPRSCEFVDALPMSGAGKPLKHELREPYWRGSNRAVH